MNKFNDSLIHAEQMSLIDKELNMTLLGALLTVIFYTNVLYGSVSNTTLFGWFILICFAYGLRFVMARVVYQLDITIEGNSYWWEKWHISGTLIAGLLWGLGSYFLLPADNPLLQAVIVLTVGGLVAASSATYAPSKYLGSAFNFTALLPLSIYFFLLDSDEHLYMGFLILIYMLVMFVSNRVMYKSSLKSVMLGMKNDVLVNDLRNKIVKIEDMANEMSYQASHDILTGLINRREFEVRLEKSIEDVKINKKNHVLCYMDLDEFKMVNDTCGHVAGDALLKELSVHLADKIRSTDTIARLGGDEFGLLLPLCKMEKAYEIAENLRKTVKEFHFTWDNKIFDIGVSIGLVEINENTGSLTDVLKSADSACYVAKESGRNRIHVYEEDDIKLSQRLGHMHCVQTIQKSLAQDRFVLYAQEILSNGDDEFQWHGEILVRMLGEEDEIISPDQFIPAAERYHLMVDIDKWVVHNAFLFIKALSGKVNRKIMCSINLSGQSVCDKYFLNYVIDKISELGVSPDNICFEVTETAAITNFFHAERLVEVLKGMGCRFSLDDFGSGLSSFGYLKKLDVDYLKIDGSFVKNMLQDAKDFAMVKSINQIGKEMEIKTIAEFVENEEIRNKLFELGVDYVQGYGVAMPVPVHSIAN